MSSSSSVFRSRKAQSRAAAPHDQLVDPLLSEEERRAALRNGGYTGEDEHGVLSKTQRDAVPISGSSHDMTLTEDLPIIVVLFLLAAALRFWQIGHPDQVVFDEVHFGKFASYYLRREYYFDVHPPFAKMLNAFAGYLAGFPGNFDFENIGDKYVPAGVPYVKLRALPAVLGSAIVPIVYAIMRETGHARAVAILSASFVLFDNAHIAQDRLILLDAALCFFLSLSLYSYIRFYKQRYNAFSAKWWGWMLATGVNLALTTSCKMVGLMTFATIGAAVVVDLWNLLDVRRGLSMQQIIRHFFARVIGLIVVPAFVYLFWFWAHFKVLTNSGPGDTFMSSQFQETLQGNPMLAQAKTVHYGDHITIKHKATNAFLHSHLDRYPLKYEDGRISSQGQQVTGYPFNDTNNVWQVVPTIPLPEESGAARMVRNGHVVRLLHVNTQSYLLTHDVASPLMSTNEEFTTVPANDTGRYNDTLFELQISGAGKNKDAWKSKSSWFKLIHVPTRVAMWTYSETPLPDWAFKQQEVNGIKNVNEKTTLWFVDELEPDKNSDDYEERSKPVPPRKVRKMSFLKKFVELQLQMLQQNAGLTQSHPYATGPINWPFLLQGISFWTQSEGQMQIYFIGNIIGWWAGILLVSVFVGIIGADTLARRRGLEPIAKHVRQRMGNSTGFFVSAWAFHYLPHFLMNRQLFLHHYRPAHICAALAAGAVFQFIAIEEVAGPLSRPGPLLAPSAKSSATSDEGVVLSKPSSRTTVTLPRAAKAIVAVFLVATVAMFLFLAPLTYGKPGLTSQQVASRKLLSTWTLHFMPSASEAAAKAA